MYAVSDHLRRLSILRYLFQLYADPSFVLFDNAPDIVELPPDACKKFLRNTSKVLRLSAEVVTSYLA